MKKIKKCKSAFSLIELSIVILIIGILVAGVTQSSRLVSEMRLATARQITKNSPVSSIKDLVVWYETSLDESLIEAEESDGALVSTWFDNNTQSPYKFNMSQSTVANQPTYSKNIINGLPSLKFDGTNDFLVTSGVGLNSKSLTAFIVGRRVNYATNFQVSLAGLALGQTDDTSSGSFVAFADFGTSFNSGSSLQWFTNSITHQGNNSPYILSTLFSGTANTIFLNGVSSTNYSINTNFTVDSLRVGCKYSNAPAYFFNGYISEIIIYSRALNTEERKSVESYLAKKYSLKIS